MSIFIISFSFSPILAYKDVQIGVCDIRPYEYSLVSGERISGDLESVYENDDNTLGIRAAWYWGGAYFDFYVNLYFFFDQIQCDELYLDYFAINTAQAQTTSIVVYYTDGTSDGTSQKPNGFHIIDLDESKFIQKVWVRFEDRSYIVSGGDRYFFVDLIAASPAGDDTPPIISIDYLNGDGTDANPGKWNVYASDPESLIDEDSVNVWVDGQLVGFSLGEYDVPNIPAVHTIYVEAENAIGCPSTMSAEIRIIDDDVQRPTISYSYDGDGTDNDPGVIIISASDESGLYIDPSGTYTVPKSLGNHGFSFSATDNDNDRPDDRLTRTISISINIVDDDDTPPEIIVQYVGESDDNNPGYFEWSVSDADSGLSEINIGVTFNSSEGLDNYSIDLGSNATGTWDLPNSLGNYTIEIIAEDSDSDRPNDALTSIVTVSNLIIDDDNTPPEIDIQYVGSGFDNDPGYFDWIVSDADSGLSEINVTITYESTEGLNNYTIPLVGTETGTWNLPPILGRYTITISARDNDDDRTLIVDSLTSEVSQEQEIVDDDVNPPVLSNLVISADIYEVNVTFDATDYSGIGEVNFLINGELVSPLSEVQVENTFSFTLENNWLFRSRTTEIVINVEDGDNDRPNDALTSTLRGAFQNVFFQMHEYIIWQIEQLKIYIDENLDERLALYLNEKLTRAQEHLYEAFEYAGNGSVTCGLYHDALAKLMVQIVEFKTEFLNWVDCIEDEHAEYIENSIHEIRNNIVLLMGVSSGTELGANLAQIEVNLLNLGDYIEDNVNWSYRCCLMFLLKTAAGMIEKVIIMSSMNLDIGCKLYCVRCILEFSGCIVSCLLNRGLISQEVANTILDGITQSLEDIGLSQDSLL
jgi:hypothetical protein